MKNTTSNKTEGAVQTAASSVAPAQVLPKEFAPIPGMNALTLVAAANIATKNQAIVQAAVEFREAYGRAGEKFFGIASALRDAKLVKKDATMLMHALGFSPSRTSEMIRLSSVSDEVWGKYSGKSVGFRAALKLENGEREGEGDGKDESSTGGKKKRQAVKIYPVTGHVKALLNELAKLQQELPMKNKKRTEYAYTVELPEGRFYHVTIFSDKE